MSILYLGDPAGALALLDRGLSLSGVVHGRRGGKGLRRLLPRLKDIPRWHLPDLEKNEVVEALAGTKPTLIVACFYPKLIPRSVLDLAPGINVHPSPLPRWRGPDPCTWSIRAGDEHTATSVHWLTEGLDEGDLLRQVTHVIGKRETTGHLAARMEADGAKQIAEVAELLIKGEPPESWPQDGTVTWAPMLEADDWEVDWTQEADTVDRFIRAALPEPGAFTGLGDELMVIHSAGVASAGAFDALPPGTPFIRDGLVHIRCGSDAICLRRVRVGRRLLNGHAFAELFV